jgi:streptogrisin C
MRIIASRWASRHRVAVGCVLVAVAALMSVVGLGTPLSPAPAARADGAAAAAPVSPPSVPNLAQEIRRRAELGFPADSGYVTSLWQAYGAGQLPGASLSEGALLTAAESEEMAVRDRAQASFADLLPFARGEDPVQFAGGYFDQRAGGIGVVRYTAGADSHLPELAARFGFPGRLRVASASHSLAELEALAQRLSTDMPRLLAAGLPISTVAADVQNNVVDVSFSRAVPANAAATLAGLYPGATQLMALSAGSPYRLNASTFTDAPPLAGGQYILNANQSLGFVFECTSNFMGYRWTTVNGFRFALPRVITAGHCGPNGSAWTQNSYPIGTMEAISTGGSADAGEIPDKGATDSSDQFLVVIGSSTFHLIVHQVQGVNTIAAGTSVCHYGTFGGYSCGTVTQTNVTMNYTDENGNVVETVTGQEVDSSLSTNGDSGGPIFQNLSGSFTGPYQADGVLDGGNGSTTSWTQEGNALAALHLDGLYTG